MLAEFAKIPLKNVLHWRHVRLFIRADEDQRRQVRRLGAGALLDFSGTGLIWLRVSRFSSARSRAPPLCTCCLKRS